MIFNYISIKHLILKQKHIMNSIVFCASILLKKIKRMHTDVHVSTQGDNV